MHEYYYGYYYYYYANYDNEAVVINHQLDCQSKHLSYWSLFPMLMMMIHYVDKELVVYVHFFRIDYGLH